LHKGQKEMKGIGSATAPRRILWHKLRNLEEALADLNRANERRMWDVCALAKAAAPALGRHNADRASTVATMLLGRGNGQAPFRKKRLVLPNGAYRGRGLLTFEKNHGPVCRELEVTRTGACFSRHFAGETLASRLLNHSRESAP
jgi:hypothetical protein